VELESRPAHTSTALYTHCHACQPRCATSGRLHWIAKADARGMKEGQAGIRKGLGQVEEQIAGRLAIDVPGPMMPGGPRKDCLAL
jgi:hypothetical protein